MCFTEKNLVKGKLLLLALLTLSLDHIIVGATFIYHICLHLILSNFLSTKDVQSLNSCRVFLRYFYPILHRIKPEIIFEIFQRD